MFCLLFKKIDIAMPKATIMLKTIAAIRSEREKFQNLSLIAYLNIPVRERNIKNIDIGAIYLMLNNIALYMAFTPPNSL